MQVELPAARDDKKTINPMVPGPGPITIISLSPCDAHAGDEAQASDVQVRRFDSRLVAMGWVHETLHRDMWGEGSVCIPC